MKIIKKGITFLFCILISVYCLTPVSAEYVNHTEYFYQNYWINQNGYYVQRPKDSFFSVNGFGGLFTENTFLNNSRFWKIGYGNIYLDPFNSLKLLGKSVVNSSNLPVIYKDFGVLFTFEVISDYQYKYITYNSDNKETIIQKFKQYDFKYEEFSSTQFKYYVPKHSIGFYRYALSNSTWERCDNGMDNCTGRYSCYYNPSLTQLKFNGQYATCGKCLGNSYIGYSYYPFVDADTFELSYYVGSMDSISASVFTADANGNFYYFQPINTSAYNNSGRNGFKLSMLMQWVPNMSTSGNSQSVIDSLIMKYKNFDTYDVSIDGSSRMMVYDSFGFLDFFDKVTHMYENGQNVRMPDKALTLLNLKGDYYNNYNNYYWWGNLQFNTPDIINPDPEQPEQPDPEKPTEPTEPDNPEQPENPTPDNTTLHYLKNIDETLTLIYNLMENGGGGSNSGGGSGLSAEQYQELISILNTIKDNMKDYSGDLTIINNTLQSINRILSENILNQYDLIYQCLNDVKALSELQNQQLTGISGVLQEMKQLFIDVYNRLGEIKDKIGGNITNIEEGTNLWDVLKALIDNLGDFLSSGLELFEKLLVPQGTFETDFNSTITSIQEKLGVLYQPVEVFSGFLTDLYAPTEVASLSETSHIISIPEVKYDGVTIIQNQELNLDETVEQSGLKPLYEVYLLIVDMIVLFGILNLAFRKFHDIITENGGDYK